MNQVHTDLGVRAGARDDDEARKGSELVAEHGGLGRRLVLRSRE